MQPLLIYLLLLPDATTRSQCETREFLQCLEVDKEISVLRTTDIFPHFISLRSSQQLYLQKSQYGLQ